VTTFLLAATLSFAAGQKKPEVDLNEKIAAARDKAIDFLKKQQHKEGHWEGTVLKLIDMEGGTTALATLALLEAGVPVNDPAVAKAIEYLAKLEPKKTYVVSLQTQVLVRVDAKKHAPQVQKNADWLIEKAIRKGDNLVGWSYPGQDLADNSNTHFAVVALSVAAQAGAKVDAKIWQQIRDLYVRSQTSGGWGYYNDRALGGERATLNMTTCALLCLALAANHDKKAKGPDPAFEKGMPALLRFGGGPSEKSEGYQRMATAELGRTLGVAEFTAGKEKSAWYREGAEKLLREQNQEGSFARGSGIDGEPVLATAFGLYFLGPPAKK
jgi:hypothetical protein